MPVPALVPTRASASASKEREGEGERYRCINASSIWETPNDVITQLDSDADGVLTGEQFAEGMKKMNITLDEEELETPVNFK